ncbi:Hg(II)-responsive transcriptional regulator [Saccharospirillum salsuginis]|uniref:Mercuric resistance operon regulatory protein n=1 Tax=Saccharospirillum salsuginis TaxID=418750 RepID=A0A918KPA9_9GAMM|nr:Hg(II)-responsive transcriptional regulator [Saccharospirillum salsuginis]GGX70872.1 mercuric resistance operon regulatory protein [Saccharospirillum salsuginis]
MPVSESLTIGALAAKAGVSVESIRFYQRKRLVREPDRPPGGIRRYRSGDIARVRFIKSSQRLGFSLDEIRELLRLDDGTHCDEARLLAEHKLADVRVKLAELKGMESALSQLVEACRGQDGSVSCPLIDRLQRASQSPDD